MTRIALSAVGAFAVAALALSSGAQAQCWWDGWTTSCAAPPGAYYAPSWGSPYAAFNAYRDYRYNPYWLPSYPGPRPGGH